MKGFKIDGERLRRLRENAGITQRELAIRLGYTERLIRKVEGGGPVRRDTLDDLVVYWAEHVDDPRDLSARSFVLGEADPGNLIRHLLDDVFVRRDLTPINRHFHPRATMIFAGEGFVGRQEIRKRLQTILDAFADIRVEIEHLHVSGNTAVAFWHMAKTHVGSFAGVAATNRRVEFRGTSMITCEADLIRSARDHWDLQHLIHQLID